MPVIADPLQHLSPGGVRVAEAERKEAAEASGSRVGLCYSWVPGSALPGERLWEKEHSEAVEVWVDISLFADDTTVVGDEEELERGVEAMKRVMGEFEERNNDGKEERLLFCLGVRRVVIYGCWGVGWGGRKT